MNRIFKNEVQSRFMRIVRQDGVAHDSPHEAEAVPASRPTHAGHSAPLLAYHASSREHTDREARSGHDQHASHSAEMFLSPNSVRIAALQDQTYCAAPELSLCRESALRGHDDAGQDDVCMYPYAS